MPVWIKLVAFFIVKISEQPQKELCFLGIVKSLPVVSNVTGDVEEQQVEEVEEESLEDLLPDQAELEEDPLDQALEEEEEGRDLAKERMASRRVTRCVIIFNLRPHVESTWDAGVLGKDKLCSDMSE